MTPTSSKLYMGGPHNKS